MSEYLSNPSTSEESILDPDVAIVGGGMVGLSLALLIVQQLPELRVALYEAEPFAVENEVLLQPSFDERSTALSASSIELFAQLGLWQQMRARAHPIDSVHVSDRGHIGQTAYSKQDNEGSSLGYVIENKWLGRCLLASARSQRNIHLVDSARVVELRKRAQSVEYKVQSNKKLDVAPVEHRASMVVIADGASSPLREALGIAVEKHRYGQAAVIANVEFDRPHQGQAFERFTRAGPLAFLPLPSVYTNSASCRSALVWTQPEAELANVLGLPDQAFIEKLQEQFGYRLGNIQRVGERQSYPLQMIFAKEQVRSGIVLMGNAAHFLHPVAGQGFNLALRDCAQLVACLRSAQLAGVSAEQLGSLEVLTRYLALQTSDQDATAILSHNFIRLFGSANPVLQLGRNMGLIAMTLFSPLQTAFFSQMMGRGNARANLTRTAVSDEVAV